MKRTAHDMEYHEDVSDAFLKTVSAFSNGHGGTIVFGATNTKIVGLANPDKAALQIENMIIDSIKPLPPYRIRMDIGNRTVSLQVEPGALKPCYWGNKTYVRRDSFSVEMDLNQLESLLLQKNNLAFDSLPSINQALTFQTLYDELKSRLALEKPGPDTLKALGLLKPECGYTIAAELLSDENRFPGIELVRYGRDENEIQNRETVENCSVLQCFKEAERFFDLYFQSELMNEAERKEYDRIPKTAFREAVLNSLIQRDWNGKNSRILIRFYDDRIRISSPGGLPEGITPEKYLHKDLSEPRNPDLAYVFWRSGCLDSPGIGVRQILSSYQNQERKPEFTFSLNVISVTLPTLDQRAKLSPDQEVVLSQIRLQQPISRKSLEEKTGFGRSKTARLLHELTDLNRIETYGNGPSTKYSLNQRPAKISGMDR